MILVMECYKEFPRSTGWLASLVSLIYLMVGTALIIDISPWLTALFVGVYLFVHYWQYPRLACVNCYYYGRRCITFKGRLAARLYARGNETRFRAGMRRAMWSVYVLWVTPFLILLAAQLSTRSINLHDLLLVAVLIALMVIRQLLRRSLGCSVCMMRDSCPNADPDPRRPVGVTNRAASGSGS